MKFIKMETRSCFFCGIGGSGMSALAQILRGRGWQVFGSDRSFDRGEALDKFAVLQSSGINLVPQDGSGITADLEMMVYSTAVEDRIPDIKRAKELGISLKHRAELLAEIFHQAPKGIAVAGTSGKSTVTAMTGAIFYTAGLDPTIINGGRMINFEGPDRLGNAIDGKGVLIAETDESDGSIKRFTPDIGVITNISVDHMPLDDLKVLFKNFVKASKALVFNRDDFEAASVAQDNTGVPAISFGIVEAADLQATEVKSSRAGSSFILQDRRVEKSVPVKLSVPGRHNIYNALAAASAALLAGITLEVVAEGLARYKGLRRRFEMVGEAHGVTVIDDFAHNPDKIAATMQTLHQEAGRVFVVYQPHGFRPTKLLKEELVQTFIEQLNPADLLIMPEIYYAGGTAQKVISSQDIVDAIKDGGRNAVFVEKRDEILRLIGSEAKAGDRVVVMGARDDTLPIFARNILSVICEESTPKRQVS